MTDETPKPDWAERYLDRRPAGGADGSVPDAVPPEAAEYMDDLAAGAGTRSAADRARYLSAAVRALVAVVDEDAPASAVTERAAAFVGEEAVVVVHEDLGELIRVDRGTAALIAFAYALDTGATD